MTDRSGADHEPIESEYDGEGQPRVSSGPPRWVVGLSALVLVGGLVVLLVVRGSTDDSPPATTDAAGGVSTTAVAGGATSTPGDTTGDPSKKQCIRWAAPFKTLAAPAAASQPGVHVWTDTSGWHVRRVPGAGVPATRVVISSTNPDQPPLAGTASGGGAVKVDGKTVLIVLPEGGVRADGSFKVPFYADAIAIDVRDGNGGAFPVDMLTVGSGTEKATSGLIEAHREKYDC